MNTNLHHTPEQDLPDPPDALFKNAMSRATEMLPPLPDLVPGAVRLGRRRRARARLAVAGSVFGVVTAVALTMSVLTPWARPGPDTGPAAPPGPPAAGPAPERTPVHVEPSPGETFARTLLPKAEQQRLTAFQQKAAVVLDDLLPAAVGTIRPLDSDVRLYQGETGGKIFPVRFTVRAEPGGSLRACKGVPEKGLRCDRVTLADGTTANAYRMPVNSRNALEVSVQYRYGDSAVSLTVSPQESSGEPAPVSVTQLVRAVDNKRFEQLVRYADDHPVLESGSTHGG
ncbi:hypothetical protein [Streptomyces sp. NPDC002994]|uniref:hypothetical protein n=1 Tax=Streptomyces sp. NPDC002994 TaxID=3154441 RepID=UPI0033B750B1